MRIQSASHQANPPSDMQQERHVPTREHRDAVSAWLLSSPIPTYSVLHVRAATRSSHVDRPYTTWFGEGRDPYLLVQRLPRQVAMQAGTQANRLMSSLATPNYV